MKRVVTAILMIAALASSSIASATPKPYHFKATSQGSALIKGRTDFDGNLVLVARGLAPNSPYGVSCEYTEVGSDQGFNTGFSAQTTNPRGKLVFSSSVAWLTTDSTLPGTITCWFWAANGDGSPAVTSDGGTATITGNLK